MEAPKKAELEEATALLQPPKPAAGCTATVRLAPRSGAVKFRTDLAKKAAAAATAAAAPTVPAAAFKSERPEWLSTCGEPSTALEHRELVGVTTKLGSDVVRLTTNRHAMVARPPCFAIALAGRGQEREEDDSMTTGRVDATMTLGAWGKRLPARS